MCFRIAISWPACRSSVAGMRFESSTEFCRRRSLVSDFLKGAGAIATAKLHPMKTADIGAALAGTQFLISMVETRLKGRNGDSGTDVTGPRELEKIEGQI